MRILLAEDDLALGAVVTQGLGEQGHTVDWAMDGAGALDQAMANAYDVLILDVRMPKRDGVEVCRALRAGGVRAPVLMVTARDTVADEVAARDAGADDYLTKPFAFDELLTRLRALVRRGTPGARLITVGDLRIDTGSHQVERGDRAIVLTATEYAVLEYLAEHMDRVVGQADICAHVWESGHGPFANAVALYVDRLRHKIDGAGGPSLIRTSRGAAYVLTADPEWKSEDRTAP